MKNFFWFGDHFNIFDLLALLSVTVGLFKKNNIYIYIGVYIQVVERILIHIKDYKNTKKLKLDFILDLVLFCMITLIFIINIYKRDI